MFLEKHVLSNSFNAKIGARFVGEGTNNTPKEEPYRHMIEKQRRNLGVARNAQARYKEEGERR